MHLLGGLLGLGHFLLRLFGGGLCLFGGLLSFVSGLGGLLSCFGGIRLFDSLLRPGCGFLSFDGFLLGGFRRLLGILRLLLRFKPGWWLEIFGESSSLSGFFRGLRQLCRRFL
ncbi:MAG: hypothetical protein PF795_07575 [Kiritimatiellae bacterium]|nr:hypothetical protein [Kiritimatiellia bacterium]